MANRTLNLDIDTILDKRFSAEVKGYSPIEVDQFLDLVIRDYESYEIMIEELKDKIDLHENQAEALKNRIAELEGKVKSLEENDGIAAPVISSNLSQVDILRRIARLEQEIFNKK